MPLARMALRRLAAIPALVATGPVAAEVCDKLVGEAWTPDHGPVWLLAPIGFPFLHAAVAVVTVVAVWRRWTAVLAIAAACALLDAGLTGFGLETRDVHRAALREGCLSEATLRADVVLLLVAAALLAYLARRSAAARSAPEGS